MQKILVLIILCLALCIAGPVNACSPIPPPVDSETGMPLYQHRGPQKVVPFDFDFTAEDAFIAVVQAKSKEPHEVIIEPFGYPVGYNAQASRFKTIEKIRGKLGKRQVFELPVYSDKWPIYHEPLDFELWESMRLPVSVGFAKGFGADCSPPIIEPSVEDGSLYIAYGKGKKLTKDNITFLSITGLNDPLIEAIRLISSNSDQSPLKYSAEEYMREATGFSEIKIKHCPGDKDFVFYSSPMIKPTNQIGNIYTLIDSFYASGHDLKNYEVNYLDIRSYQSELSSNEDFLCNAGDHYFILHSKFPKFLSVDNGLVTKNQIQTNIEITGPDFFAIDQVKAWIKAGQASE